MFVPHELSFIHTAFGDLGVYLGNGPAAAEHHQASLDIAQQLATADPGNAQIQQALAALRAKLDELGPQDPAANAAD
ncbi:MAG TPA: hypothetical protein VFU36_16240 [Jatrophihabitans sp.]|nr:hypothetical protein [Jatrophihabitans sp.]